MPRKGPAPRRELVADPIYKSVLITQLVNKVMLHGKRTVAEKIVYDAMEMIVDRILEAREADWDAENRRTMALAHLGGATLDNEENYLIKKLLTSLGVVQVENQARI